MSLALYGTAQQKLETLVCYQCCFFSKAKTFQLKPRQPGMLMLDGMQPTSWGKNVLDSKLSVLISRALN